MFCASKASGFASKAVDAIGRIKRVFGNSVTAVRVRCFCACHACIVAVGMQWHDACVRLPVAGT